MKKSPQQRSLLRHGAVTASATLASRILGMLRDICIANALGAGLSADVFFFANRIPNFFRRLFAEGAFAQAFVPVLTRTAKEQSHAQLRELVSRSAGTLGGLVLGLTLLGMAGAPLLTALFGWGWYQEYLEGAPDGAKFTEASVLLRITFPYLLLVTLTALAGSVLNVFGHFGVPAITPCLLNLTLIGCALFILPGSSHPNEVLAWGMVAGGVVQLLFQVPFIYRLHLLCRPRWGWRHPGVRRIYELMLPAILGVSASQLNLFVNTLLASFLATGAISYLYYSDRLLEFPIGIVAVAVSTVILPALSRIDLKSAPETYRRTLSWGAGLVLFLGLPAMCGLIVLREGLIRVIFMRGEFTPAHVSLAAASLLASASGLCAMMLVRVLVQGFAALQDTATPVRCSVASIAANIVFNLILIGPLGYVGLALSTALAAYVNAGLLLYLLHRRKIYSPGRAALAFIARALMAALLMSAVLEYLNPAYELWTSWSTARAGAQLLLLILAGAGAYFAGCLLCGLKARLLTPPPGSP